MRSAEHDKKHADIIDGVATAKDQKGLDYKGNPRKSDNKTWQFGDSLADIKPNRLESDIQLRQTPTQQIDDYRCYSCSSYDYCVCNPQTCGYDEREVS